MIGHDWPPLLIARLAYAYTGRSRWTVARAVRDGALRIAGRNGRSPVFKRADLDAWLLGDVATNSKGETSTLAPIRTRAVAPSANAIDRVKAIARGGR